MNAIPLDKIQEVIGADAVLYVQIENWGQKYQIVNSTTVVSAKLKLVDTGSGKILWTATAHAERSANSNQGGGLANLLLNALVNQIVASAIDYTPELATNANNMAIYNSYRGLLDGPYKVMNDKAKAIAKSEQ